jgi:hypothetical protein
MFKNVPAPDMPTGSKVPVSPFAAAFRVSFFGVAGFDDSGALLAVAVPGAALVAAALGALLAAADGELVVVPPPQAVRAKSITQLSRIARYLWAFFIL